jgi:hypothetical protein
VFQAADKPAQQPPDQAVEDDRAEHDRRALSDRASSSSPMLATRLPGSESPPVASVNAAAPGG